METNLSKDEIIQGRDRFFEFVSVDSNKQLLFKTIENCINGKEWPMSYFQLRSEYLPGIMGERASKFFFWLALGGHLSEEFNLDDFNEEELVLINYIIFNYGQKFIKAKEYNINPFGINSVNFAYAQNEVRFNIYLQRNDEQQFLLKTDVLQFSNMVCDLLDYFSKLLSSNILNINIQKHDLQMNIRKMKDILDAIDNYLAEEEHSYEGV